MLLNSSQVSIAISGGIILFFTTALFLSGVAIQHRTLRNLQSAIKPMAVSEPLVYLPDRFKKTTTELEDGTIVTLADDWTEDERARALAKGIRLEVRPTPQSSTDNDNKQQKPLQPQQQSPPKDKHQVKNEKNKESVDKMKDGKKGKKDSSSSTSDAPAEEQEEEEQPLSRAERRRRIKEEIQRLAQGGDNVRKTYYRPRLGW